MTTNKKSYYGPFFWLALVSFTVPLVVASKAFNSVRPLSQPTPQPDASGVDNALWDYLLKTYVSDSLVDYDGMARDHLLRTYIRQIGAAKPSKLSSGKERFALLCNAYNALVIHGVITHRIRDSVNSFEVDGIGFFDLEEHILFGQTVSLNYIEHQLIRARYREPRVHVALVCAARSCPAIRPEAYVGSRILSQLEDQSRLFANNRHYLNFDPVQNRLRLSPILKWYGDDWESVGGYLPWLAARVRDPEVKLAIKRAIQGEVSISFVEYDWSLNTQSHSSTSSLATSPAVAQPAGFGSGSIPNKSPVREATNFGSGSIPNQ